MCSKREPTSSRSVRTSRYCSAAACGSSWLGSTAIEMPWSPNEFSVPVIPPDAARLIPSTAMIDEVPMIIPSMVSSERVRLRQMAENASAR